MQDHHAKLQEMKGNFQQNNNSKLKANLTSGAAIQKGDNVPNQLNSTVDAKSDALLSRHSSSSQRGFPGHLNPLQKQAQRPHFQQQNWLSSPTDKYMSPCTAKLSTVNKQYAMKIAKKLDFSNELQKEQQKENLEKN